ncbi:MAG TPA: hypothetical protein VHM24_03360 [Gemmatimonadaceae bacterium]|nr:hypothetical protein [Gemmatimonadaceae bacterium]
MIDTYIILAPVLLLPIVALLSFVGCSSFTGTAMPVIIKLDPTSVDLGPGESRQFTALADGIITTAVTWSPNAPGGLYKAADPRVAGSTKDTITATSTSDPTAIGSATVNLKSVTVVVTPATVSLRAGEQQTFTAKVQPTPDQAVTWTNAVNGVFTAPSPYIAGSPPVTVTATSNADPSAKGTATVNLVGPQAQFVTTDTTTKGTWSGVYGSKGWALAKDGGNIVKPAPFVSVLKLPTTPVFTFADPTADPRGLQRPPMFTDRFAATWFDSNSLQLEIEFSDFALHRVAVYFVDWETTQRVQKIELRDGSPAGAVLDSRSVSGFSGGQYLIWDLAGKVVMTVSRTGSVNAVINAVFFD